jgi:hypothetical protein
MTRKTVSACALDGMLPKASGTARAAAMRARGRRMNVMILLSLLAIDSLNFLDTIIDA